MRTYPPTLLWDGVSEIPKGFCLLSWPPLPPSGFTRAYVTLRISCPCRPRCIHRLSHLAAFSRCLAAPPPSSALVCLPLIPPPLSPSPLLWPLERRPSSPFLGACPPILESIWRPPFSFPNIWFFPAHPPRALPSALAPTKAHVFFPSPLPPLSDRPRPDFLPHPPTASSRSPAPWPPIHRTSSCFAPPFPSRAPFPAPAQ